MLLHSGSSFHHDFAFISAAQQMLAAGIQDEPSSLFRGEENASNSNDVRPCLSADSSASVQSE